MIVEPGRRFFFVHLQKTAGTTLFRRLRHHFGAHAVYPMPQYQGEVEATLDVELLTQRFADHADEIQLVTGHFPLCVTELLDAEFTVLTLLREPVERALSFLRHQREVSPQFAESALEEIYEDPLCREALLRNHMVRMLSMTTDEMTDGVLTQVPVDDTRLETARRNLHDRIDTVGVQEDFEAFCRVLTARYGWKLGPSHRANQTAPVETSDAFRQRIAVDNAMDAELYRSAVELWQKRKAVSSP